MKSTPAYGSVAPEATLDSVVAALGNDVLRSVLCPERPVAVSGIRIHEANPAQELARSEIVLAIGIEHPRQLVPLLTEIDGKAAALVVKCQVEHDAELFKAAVDNGCAILILDDRVEWLQAVALMQGEIAQQAAVGHHRESRKAQGQPHDLFELADLAAAGVGGPVTIEDEHGWLLGYSRDQHGGDLVREDTLMSRRRPEEFTQALKSRGILQQLSRSDQPLAISNITDGVADRLAISLKSGNYALGTMWAVVSQPDMRQIAVFTQVALQVALQRMRGKTEEYRAHRVEMEQLAVLLHGGPAVTSTDDESELPSGAHWVVALSLAPSKTTERAVTRSRLEQRLALMQRPADMTVHAGQLSNLWYLILTINGPSDHSATRVLGWLDDLLTDSSLGRLPIYGGIGAIAWQRVELPRSRKEAERALAVARLEAVPGVSLTFEACWARAALLRVLDTTLMADLESLTPLPQLREYDHAHGTEYVPTLAAWLSSQGNIRTAAEQLHIHTNTLRYRIAKLEAVASIDLTDPDVRLILTLQLRTS